MIDIETMDNVATSTILSIGAVQCNIVTGETEKEFYAVVNLKGQLDAGCSINHETLYWWLEQSDGARSALTIPNKLLPMELCESFNRWVHYLEPNNDGIRMWSNGASFDIPILRHFYRQYGADFPTKFWNDRDMRTIVGFYPPQLQEKWKKENMRQGVFHNALDDAKHQVKYCSHILQELGVEELY